MKPSLIRTTALLAGLPILATLPTLATLSSPGHAADSPSDPLVTEFNDADTGVAFSMLSETSWKTPGSQLFHATPTTPQPRVQAVTISNATKKLMPYQGDSRYGIVFSIGPTSDFYQYFATKSAFSTACGEHQGSMVTPITKAPGNLQSSVANWAVDCNGEQIAFCGRCADGGPCAGSGNTPNGNNGLWPALGTQVSYDQFNKAKNAIVAASGSTKTCGQWVAADNIWNEFDTNGLSPSALAGVMIDQTSAIPPGSYTPTDDTLCAYLQNANPAGSSWGVYTLSFTGDTETPSKLSRTRTLSCPANG